jgi:hypothetical protein
MRSGMARSTVGTEFEVGEEGDGAATWGTCAPPWRDLRWVRRAVVSGALSVGVDGGESRQM